MAVDVLPPAYTADYHSKVVGQAAVVTSVGTDVARAGLRVGDAVPFNAWSYVRQYALAGGNLQTSCVGDRRWCS